jgi:hypothetical protein
VAAPTETELFSGRVSVGGSAFYSFTVGVNGTVNVNLADVGGAGVPSTVWLGARPRHPSGEDCAAARPSTRRRGTAVQLTGTYAPGVYCVRVCGTSATWRPWPPSTSPSRIHDGAALITIARWRRHRGAAATTRPRRLDHTTPTSSTRDLTGHARRRRRRASTRSPTRAAGSVTAFLASVAAADTRLPLASPLEVGIGVPAGPAAPTTTTQLVGPGSCRR